MAKPKRTTRHAKMVTALSSGGSSRKRSRRIAYDPNRGVGNTSIRLDWAVKGTPDQPPRNID